MWTIKVGMRIANVFYGESTKKTYAFALEESESGVKIKEGDIICIPRAPRLTVDSIEVVGKKPVVVTKIIKNIKFLEDHGDENIAWTGESVGV